MTWDISEGCPNNKIDYRSTSTNKYIHRRVVQKKRKEIISESCPKNCIGKLSNSSCRRLSKELFWRVVQQFTSKDCPTYSFGGLSNNKKIISKIDKCVFINKNFLF